MTYLFPIVVLANFAAGLAQRTLDPVLPLVGLDLLLTAQVVATLSSAVAISFALVQLPLGAVADLFGKPRLIMVGLIVLALSSFAGALASSFEVLFVTRILVGLAAGSVFPVTMALTADLFSVEERRVAMSRLVAGTQIGNLLGASIAGVLGDIVGWRGVLTTLGATVFVASVAIAWGFRNQMGQARASDDVRHIAANYKRILSDRNSQISYFGAFTEGVLLFGMIPFVAAFFVEMGEPRSAIAGIVIGGHAIGGLIYALSVKRVLPLLGERGLMKLGAVLIGSQIVAIGFGPPWPVQFVSFLAIGFGFYALHGGFLMFNTEVAPQARSSALSLSAFCLNMGQFIGPLVYGFALLHFAKLPSLMAFGALMTALGIGCTMLLGRHLPEPDRP